MTKKIICENCGSEIQGKEYKDEYGGVMINYDCPYCGFKRRWAYGHTQYGDSEFLDDENKRWNECISARKRLAFCKWGKE